MSFSLQPTMLRRTPLRSSKGPARKRSLSSRSAKQKALYEKRRPLVEEMLREHPRCQAAIPNICWRNAVDVHEIKTRARGGSILDKYDELGRVQLITVCRACHGWIDENQEEAHERGLLRHSWE